MAVNTKTFTDLVQAQVAAIQGAAAGLIDFTVGAIERAIVEAVAQVALWLQGLILVLLATTRASTSVGPDLDSWMAQFNFPRLQPSYATGQVTFSRFSTTGQGLVPVATSQVELADGSVQYQVQVDATNPAYSSALGGYVLANGIGSVTVPVQALTAGSAGNAAPGAVSQIVSAIPGIDTVTNASAFEGGADAELDADYRTRFWAYLASLSKATKAAILYAITSVQPGAIGVLTENYAYSGAYQPGYFYAVVDDGSGSPPSSFLNAEGSAIEAVRPFTVTYGVFGPSGLTANISLIITAAAGYDPTALVATVQAAILAYIASLGLGATLPYTRLAQVAYDASPGVSNVASVLLNSGTADLVATTKQKIEAGTVTVSHS